MILFGGTKNMIGYSFKGIFNLLKVSAHMYMDTRVYMHVHINRRGSDQIPGPKG